MWTIAKKEMRELLYSPKFIVLLITAVVLILVSVFNGFAAYRAESESIALGEKLAKEQLGSLESYFELRYRSPELIRPPRKLSIFDIGITGYIGRTGSAGWAGQSAKSENSRFSQNPVLALFGELDLTFITGFVLSLFALLISYSSVNGERERGTLPLMLSNRLRRTSLIVGKFVGAYIPLALTFLLPLLTGLLVLMLATDINFSADEWIRIALMAALHLLYLLVFLTIGIAMSALTRHAFTSFVLCLFVWVASVVVVPKLAVHASAHLSPSMSASELEKRSRSLVSTLDERPSYVDLMRDYLKENPIPASDFTREREREVFSAIRGQYDISWKEQEKEYERLNEILTREYKQRRMAMVECASSLCRVSPTASLSLAMHALAGTGPRMLENFTGALDRYGKDFRAYANLMVEKQEREQQQRGSQWNRVSVDGIVRYEENKNYQPPELDLSGMPVFVVEFPDVVETGGEVLPYFTVLALTALVFFAAAYVAFLRYDVRL